MVRDVRRQNNIPRTLPVDKNIQHKKGKTLLTKDFLNMEFAFKIWNLGISNT